MKKISLMLLLAAASLTSQAQLVSTLNFSTGYDNVSGTAMAVGTQDPNWKITALTSPLIPAGSIPYDSYTQTPWALSGSGNPVTPANTQWISYDGIGMTLSAPPDGTGGSTTYQYTFETCHRDDISFNATMRSDNRITAVRIDGAATGYSQTLTSANWSVGSGFSYSVTLAPGVHTIEVDVLNYPSGNATNPTGLNVDGNITSSSNSIVDRDNFPDYRCCNANFHYCMSTLNNNVVDFTPDDPSQPGTYDWYVNGAYVGSTAGGTFSYTFPGPGSYQVCLRFTDKSGEGGCDKCINICIADNPDQPVMMKNTSGVKSAATKQSFEAAKIYPNPTSAEVNIELQSLTNSTVTIKLFDVMGKVVKEKNVTLRQGQQKISISTDGLPNGTYSLHLSNGEKVVKEKIQVIK